MILFLIMLFQKTPSESIRKLSNFNSQWTKILYQNNLKNIAFFVFILCLA